jgi:ABC-type multidrug transport system fused ATPase/permease subunit
MLSEILIYKELYSYFPINLKKKFLLIVLSTLLLGFFEMVSIGMIIPILLIILDIRPEGFLSQAKINLNLIYFTEINIVPFIVAIFFLLFVIRSVYSIWHSHYQSQYIYEIQKFVASRLYELRGFPFFDKDKKGISRKTHISDVTLSSMELGPYDHFMQKEIYEQPRALTDTIEAIVDQGHFDVSLFGQDAKDVFPKIDSCFPVNRGHWNESSILVLTT